MKKHLDKKIVFIGTPHIAASFLESLIDYGFNIIAIIAQPDMPVGRKQTIVAVPTKRVALDHGIKVYQPIDLNDDYQFIEQFDCDLIISFAYGQIIPQAVLSWPKYGSFNIHPSLLPALRGAAPIQYALLEGLSETGVSLIEMSPKLDAGHLYYQFKVTIDQEDNYTSLLKKMVFMINEKIPPILEQLFDNSLTPSPQDDHQATYAPTISKSQEHLNIHLSTRAFHHYVRALSERPAGYIIQGVNKIKIFKGRPYDTKINGPVGRLYLEDKKVLLQLVDGRYQILMLQFANRNVVDDLSFYNGYAHLDGSLWL